MNTPASKPKYVFINPNTPEEFTQEIQKIIIDKLLTLQGASGR